MSQFSKVSATRHIKVSRRRQAVLPHLGSMLLGNLYHVITGSRRAPSSLVRRAIANGLDKQELTEAAKQARSAHELQRILASVSQERLRKAHYWSELGLKPRARDNYLESALWGMYAELLASDFSQKTKLFEQVSFAYEAAAPHFTIPAEPVEIPYLAGNLKGYLRIPAAGDAAPDEYIRANHPCVILFNTVGAMKEELHLTENALLAAGLATLSFDYPGSQGSAQALLSFDVEELGNALFLFLSTRNDIDCSRIALHGLSLGGRVALYVAVRFPGRFRALATLSAPLELLSDLELLMPALRRELAVATNVSKAAIFDFARQTPLRGLLQELETPLLVAGGGKDLIALPEETKDIYEQAGSTDKKLLICPGASHNCPEMMPSLRHEIAQWIKQRL